jgi:hypothetical protein
MDTVGEFAFARVLVRAIPTVTGTPTASMTRSRIRSDQIAPTVLG